MRTLIVAILSAFAVAALADDVLLAPSSSSGAQRIMMFSAVDGSLINANFIVSGQNGAPTMTTPKQIIDSGRNSLLVSDQVANAIWEFGYDGTFLGTIASAAQGLSNLRGLAARNGSVYVTVGGGTLTNTVQRFDLNNGNAQSTFIGSGLSSPFDIHFRANDVLVTNSSGSTLVSQFDLNGNSIGAWATSTSSAMRFPQQINTDGANGELLIAGFSVPAGVYRFDANGNALDTYAPGLGHRGAIRLDNGNILFTISTGVGIWNTATNTRGSDVITGVNAQYVERINMPVPEPASIAALGLGLAAILKRRRK